MTIQILQTSTSASAASIRGHRVTIDRPSEKGGADEGPMGGELFLAAIGGCFMSNLLAAIAAREVEVSDVQAEVTATLDGSPGRFTGICIDVSASCADEELFARLVEVAQRGCIMINTRSGKLDVQVRIRAGLKGSQGFSYVKQD